MLTAAIIKNMDQLFFVSHSIGANNARKWHLARVASTNSVSIYPLCTLGGRFLFEFYICHSADWQYNTVNQRYWMRNHGWEDIKHLTLSTKTVTVAVVMGVAVEGGLLWWLRWRWLLEVISMSGMTISAVWLLNTPTEDL